MRVSAAVVAFLLAAAPSIAAQPPQPGQPTPGQPPSPGQRTPPRAAPLRPGEQPPTGTAVLRGQVFSVDGTPLRRAQVRAMAQDGRGGGTSSTDPQGKFEIKELPAGRYSITASKAGYVMMQFGQRRADQPGGGTILDVLDSQIVEKINFALPRGGVITGRVLDEFGEPIAGAQVAAMRSRFVGGSRRMMSTGGDSTDDTGAFRIYGLAPGEYYVSGNLRTMTMMMPGMTSADSDGYAPSYFPGTPNLAEAQRVAVKGGQEVSGVNFALAAARLARVRGRVTNAAGEPGASMMVMVRSGDPYNAMTMTMNSAQTRGDGTFQVAGLAPGSYVLMTRSMTNPMDPEIGQLRLTITNEDIDNVLIVTSRGAVARGTITTDDGTPLPLRPQQVRLFAQPADPADAMLGMGVGPPIMNEDWTFEMSGLVDRRLLRASLAEPSGWFLKAVLWRGQDVTDTPIEFTPGQAIEDLQFVFTQKVTEVTGIVRDERGQPALGTRVVIFPNDPARWVYASRYIRPAAVDQQGRYSLKNLPAYDDYRVVAVQDLEAGRETDPEFLESVRDAAARVTLLEGQTAVQDLKVVRAP
jgi:hypothetical protein